MKLDKTICYNCATRKDRGINISTIRVLNTRGINDSFYTVWKAGYVWCPFKASESSREGYVQFFVPQKSSPYPFIQQHNCYENRITKIPEECPYKLEHVLKQGK